MNHQISRKTIAIWLALILSIAILLRLINLAERPFWTDEVGHLNVALSPSLIELFKGVQEHAAASPLDYLLLRAYQSITGSETPFELRLPYVFYGVVGIYLVYQLGKSLYNPATGLLNAFALSISVFHIYYSQEVRFYALSSLLGTVSTLAFLNALKKPSWSIWILWAVVNIAGLYTHYFFSFPVHCSTCLVDF
jgi:mannosyltransferase